MYSFEWGLLRDSCSARFSKSSMNKRTCIKIFQSPQAHVVQVIGLMVGPGRIGIVMELCDTSLAKRIQERSAAVNWAETVRLLMDGTAGLGFIHKQKRTTL